MPRSLSLILPVYNAQESLSATLAEMLELLPELTSRFEVQLIDDGSLDATMEVASELVGQYPQVRLLAHPARLGMRICAETGMRHSGAEWILYREADCCLDLQGIAKLWKQIGEFDCLLGRRAAGTALGWIPRLPKAGITGPEHDGMILARRAVMNQWLVSPMHQNLETYLVRAGIAWKAVDVRPRLAETSATVAMGSRKRQPAMAGGPSAAEGGPNYLRKITEFALGE